jgi:hypothetical protein
LSFLLLIRSSFLILLSHNYSNQFPPLWDDPLVKEGGCTQATYANCFNALKFDKTSSPYFPKAPTCSDKNIKWSEVGWTDFANAQKDIATIRVNPAIASFIDCVCKSVCGEFQDFKDAAITTSGACAVAAATVLTASYSRICKDPSKYTPTAIFHTSLSYTCDEVMNIAAAGTLKHVDFSSEFTCGGETQPDKGIINSYSARCCGGGQFACRINGNGEYPNEKWSWVTASGKNICAGINTNCGDWTVNPPNKLSSCTTLGVGPCEGTATSPASYLKMAFSGIRTVASGGGDGFWNPTTTNPSGATNLFPFDGPSYRDYKADVPSGDTSKFDPFCFFRYFLTPPLLSFSPSFQFALIFFFFPFQTPNQSTRTPW